MRPSSWSPWRIVWITSRPRPAGIPIFSCAGLQHRLAVRFLQILQLLLVLIPEVLRVRTKRVLHAALAVFNPLLDLGGCQVVGTVASAIVVFPWMISSTNALLRRGVQRLISSSINVLMCICHQDYT